jgi:hypothetical protein
MKTLLVLFLSFIPLPFAFPVGAQTAISVDINKAVLRWNWVQGTGDPAQVFKVKCGTQSKVYTRITDILYVPSATNTFQTPIRPLIGGSGNWFCAVSAANQIGESGVTNEVNFFAGALPSAPTNAEVVAQ